MTRAAVPLRAVALAVLLGFTLAAPASAQTPYHKAPPPGSCPGDHVVWVNTHSGVYHYRGERYFGSTRYGRFECERQAQAEGDRPTRNGQ